MVFLDLLCNCGVEDARAVSKARVDADRYGPILECGTKSVRSDIEPGVQPMGISRFSSESGTMEIIIKDEAFAPGIGFSRAGSGTHANSDVGSGSADRFAGEVLGTVHVSFLRVNMCNILGVLDAPIAIVDSL